MVISSARCRPRMISATPATRWNQIIWSCSAKPTTPSDAPSTTKTTEKPATKAGRVGEGRAAGRDRREAGARQPTRWPCIYRSRAGRALCGRPFAGGGHRVAADAERDHSHPQRGGGDRRRRVERLRGRRRRGHRQRRGIPGCDGADRGIAGRAGRDGRTRAGAAAQSGGRGGARPDLLLPARRRPPASGRGPRDAGRPARRPRRGGQPPRRLRAQRARPLPGRAVPRDAALPGVLRRLGALLPGRTPSRRAGLPARPADGGPGVRAAAAPDGADGVPASRRPRLAAGAGSGAASRAPGRRGS